VFNIDSQSGRELRQYLSSIASRCISRRTHNDDDDDDVDNGNELPAVIILDGLHRITATPLGDIFSALLDVQLCDRSLNCMPRYIGAGDVTSDVCVLDCFLTFCPSALLQIGLLNKYISDTVT